LDFGDWVIGYLVTWLLGDWLLGGLVTWLLGYLVIGYLVTWIFNQFDHSFNPEGIIRL